MVIGATTVSGRIMKLVMFLFLAWKGVPTIWLGPTIILVTVGFNLRKETTSHVLVAGPEVVAIDRDGCYRQVRCISSL